MAGNQLRSRRNFGDELTDVLNQTLDRSTTLQIHKRKASGKEIIPEMHYIRRAEEDHTVAIRMTVRKVNRTNVFAVEMYRQRIIERDYRQRFFRRRRRRAIEHGRLLFGRKTLAHVVVRDDRRLWSKHDVAARMISVPVSVENEV